MNKCENCTFWIKGQHAGRCVFMGKIPKAYLYPLLPCYTTANHTCAKHKEKEKC